MFIALNNHEVIKNSTNFLISYKFHIYPIHEYSFYRNEVNDVLKVNLYNGCLNLKYYESGEGY